MSKKKELAEIEQQISDLHAALIFDKPCSELTEEEMKKVRQYEYDLDHPIWKPVYINGEKSTFEVSNIGSIMNLKIGRMLKSVPDKQGYLRILLTCNNKRIPRKMHRLVAEAFIPNPENKPQVNHINGKKDFNWVGNLEWNTSKENVQHSWRTGLITAESRMGTKSSSNKYTEAQIHDVCRYLEEGMEKPEISKITNVPMSTINSIIYHGYWNCISKDYNIPKPHSKYMANNSRFTENQISGVCKLLEEKVKPTKIKELTGIPLPTISAIKHHKSWTFISDRYKF